MQDPCRIGTAPFLDGVVVHDGRTGRLFQLNHTAAQVWRSLRDGDPEDAILGALTQTHGLDPVTVRGDLESFAHAVRSAGLHEPHEVSERHWMLRTGSARSRSG